MKPTWILDEGLITETYHEYGSKLVKSLENSQTNTLLFKYQPFLGFNEETIKLLNNLKISNTPCVVYGSIEFIREIRKYNILPGIYYSDENFKITKYLHQYPENIFLNEDYISIPFGLFKKENLERYFKYFNSNSIFIKPDSGFKTFSGVNIDNENYRIEVETIKQLSSATENTISIISGSKKILEEYRFFIINKRVVSGSMYMKNNKFNSDPFYPENAKKVAEMIANNNWEPDICYTCDVAFTGKKEYKVIELNSFSCAGLYSANIDEIVKNVNKAAIMEHNGEISILN